ncbi:MAG: hypothetical protein M3Q73_03100 [bacterium]|nr:hypothetical protein [bacterium]
MSRLALVAAATAALSTQGARTVSPDFRDDVSLEAVIGFQFQPLVDRMVDKYGREEGVAQQAFEDMKKFLYLCGASTEGKPFAPTEPIDELWHNFILFTEDYTKFCREHFGRFIHHRPRRRDDLPSKDNAIKHTLQKAQQLFGPLSVNWQFKRPDGTVIHNSDSDCQCVPGDAKPGMNIDCSPSTNCQDSDCHDSKVMPESPL